MYNEIKNDDDIRALMKLYGGFHDSCIVSVNYSSGAFVDSNGGMADGSISEHCVNMVVHSQWCKPIELRFTGVRKCSIVGWQDNYFCNIYGARIGFNTQLLGKTRDDKLIVWADEGCFDPLKYTEDKLISSRNCTYVIAEKLYWKIEN
ncbi:MAG: hypothetical protein IJN85_02795 [Oscillospiraceae bacterium]|nr:hypothetical protein [Oscillospiraceae bacterium]